MLRACRGLNLAPDLVLVDGRFTPALGASCRAEIDGDARIPEIMAASILAKTARDRWMARYARIDGRYGFESHFGYATRAHRERLRLHGLPVQAGEFRALMDVELVNDGPVTVLLDSRRSF